MLRNPLQVLLSGFFILLLLAVPGAAAASPASHSPAGERAAAVRDFWTPKRMAKAIDMSAIVSPSARTAGRGSGPRPDPASGRAVSPPGLRHQFAWDADPAIGRLFFRWRGRKASCSGSVIDTTSRRLVLTAGHCLKYAGVWSRYLYFAPAYFFGRRPKGTWTWTTAWVTGPWARHSDEHMANYDLGVIVTRRSMTGMRIGDVAGALPFQMFSRRSGMARIYGYPMGASRGREVRVCARRHTWPGPWYSYRLPGPVGVAAWCDMAAGSSGGPWLSAYRNGSGGIAWEVDGVTSTGSRGRRLASPYFGIHFRRLIHNAEYR